mmetsp:Transcript_31041/g.77623  ORF Transcript_31041/g.77623 Transcript_31041/m.77623 type:complete len:220 (-) Transcript_31041:242-901(-)|eukprot:CAMPEP_0180066582 /NCGR_PEP_ID=MMETSP0985-20121206/9377_1 /TAXON_ID=483367 /ORGANISM="non described non described, Strain CCMP 2436" /LENGTH=219 /DNA_ID=CAMNT_0021997131 /DNA_START=1430 /DNA_END=2089 /DNA_ORIENTATION=-
MNRRADEQEHEEVRDTPLRTQRRSLVPLVHEVPVRDRVVEALQESRHPGVPAWVCAQYEPPRPRKRQLLVHVEHRHVLVAEQEEERIEPLQVSVRVYYPDEPAESVRSRRWIVLVTPGLHAELAHLEHQGDAHPRGDEQLVQVQRVLPPFDGREVEPAKAASAGRTRLAEPGRTRRMANPGGILRHGLVEHRDVADGEEQRRQDPGLGRAGGKGLEEAE